MIGIIAREAEILAVKEFFELFKTPWETVEPGKPYDVVLTTRSECPEANCKLLLLYGSQTSAADASHGFTIKRTVQNQLVQIQGESLVIYGKTAFFDVSPDRSRLEGARMGAAVSVTQGVTKVMRVGYDLFEEVDFLLSRGQPVKNALLPTLDLHIEILRQFILKAGLPVLEIPCRPHGTAFISCLTHDVDFVFLRQHLFDHSMWGFLYRATIGTTLEFVRGRKSFQNLMRNWGAALKLPFVYLGICEDFWQQFGGYLEIEEGKPSTFFIIPFKDRAGLPMKGSTNKRRATRYDVSDVPEWMSVLQERGCEVALHGLDAWADEGSARRELDRIAAHTKVMPAGVRMHWLYFAEGSATVLDRAGAAYDSTSGFNDAIGFKAGTMQVFQPPGTANLLELPMHIQDTALFYPGRMHLTESKAWELCTDIIAKARRHGGVVTLLWHDRSLAPERLWGEFYGNLLKELAQMKVWFATASQVVSWFRARREIRFGSVRSLGSGIEVDLNNVPGSFSRDFALRISWMSPEGMRHEREIALEGRGSVSLPVPFPRAMAGSTVAPSQARSETMVLSA